MERVWRSYKQAEPTPRLCYIVRSQPGRPYARTCDWSQVPTLVDEMVDMGIDRSVIETLHDATVCDMPSHAALRA